MAARTFLDSIMWHNCYRQGAVSSGSIRDLTDQGAEFHAVDWINVFVYMFNLSLYDYDRDISIVTLPRLTVEFMQIIIDFAEGELDPLCLHTDFE